MTITLFILGTLLALCIARYNESNKLFWQLMLAFILGYTATVMVDRTINGSERNDEALVQVSPTQTPIIATNVFTLVNNAEAPEEVTDPESVVKEMPELYKSIVSSKVFGRTRDQPVEYINTS